MKLPYISAAAALLLTSAAGYISTPTALNYGVAPDEGYETFLAAERNSNVSHAAAFPQLGPAAADGSLINWTWEVTVSDVSLPNVTTAYPNARMPYTTYRIRWPEQGDLNEALRAEYNASGSYNAFTPPCAMVFQADFPQNVSDKYDSHFSNCSSALGDDCVKAIEGLISNTTHSEDCYLYNFDLGNPVFVEACASSFGAILTAPGGNNFYGVSPMPFGNASAAAAANQTDVLQSGETWLWQLGNPYPPDNKTLYDQAADRMHVLVFTGRYPQVLCNRARIPVDKSAAPGRAGAGLAVLSVAAMLVAALV